MGEVTNFTDYQLERARADLRHEVKYPPFDPTVAEAILDAIRCGMSLRTVKQLASTPRWGIVRTWMETNIAFKQAYDDAMQDQAELHIERGDSVAGDVDRNPACRKVELDWLRDRINWARGKEAPGTTVNVAVQTNVTVPPGEAYQRMLRG